MTIEGATRRDETILRLGGNGDCWHMTWAADDRQLAAFCDGLGLSDDPKRFYNGRTCAIVGGPTNARLEDVPGYPDIIDDPDNPPDPPRARYYGWGTLALDGSVCQFLATFDVGFDRPARRFVGAKLIYSPDGGRTWRNQDGSTPVVWEPLDGRSRENMAFFEEPQDAFSMPTILQMGRDYTANTDGYVYVYAPNGNTDGTMNELVMLRVPKERILDRGAYEYFAGRRPDGGADWVGDIEQRGVVHTFPRGWVNSGEGNPHAWSPSVVYNEPLGVYMMASAGMGCRPDGRWFGKPSYLGLWSAPSPWGPWTQIHEEDAWTPAGDPRARCYQPQIAPKWIAPDGKSFWLAWTDFQTSVGEDFIEEMERISERASTHQEELEAYAALLPYYRCNVQRVDLTVA